MLFAALVGVLASTLLLKSCNLCRARWWLISAVFFAATAAHGFLDAATDAGLGIGFFIPIDNERYFLPFRPLETSSVSPLHFLREWQRAIAILGNEFLWVWVPLLTLSGAFQLLRRLAGNRSPDTKEEAA